MGYLEGTQKAAHTIKNYRLDLLAFQDFLLEQARAAGGKAGSSLQTERLGQQELEQYHQYLRNTPLRTNTRRRKLLTAQRFLRYLSQRKQLQSQVPVKLSAPHKIERIPHIVPLARLLEAIRALPLGTRLDRRNRLLLWVLAETGCLVSEATQLEARCFAAGSGAWVEILGKAPRKVPVSEALFEEIQAYASEAPSGKAGAPGRCLFPGYNKHGSLGSPITSRGVELLVRYYAPRLEHPELTPRTFRHSAVVAWLEQGLPQGEIQARLGLKTAYAFRMYAPWLKASSETAAPAAQDPE